MRLGYGKSLHGKRPTCCLRLAWIVMAMVALAFLTDLTLAHSSQIQVLVNGEPLGEGYFAVVVDDVIMIPAEAVINALGGKMRYDSSTNTVDITLATVCSSSSYASDGHTSGTDTDGEISPEDVTVFIAKSGSKYHCEGCRYLSTGGDAIVLSDAKRRGYGPCKVCNPPQ
ncbi:MAG: hypothetical protein ACOYET_00480 [Bacillota bacterium]|jgi:hypothetical protein